MANTVRANSIQEMVLEHDGLSGEIRELNQRLFKNDQALKERLLKRQYYHLLSINWTGLRRDLRKGHLDD